MIRGVGPLNRENLRISGPEAINSLKALARENGASTLRIQGTLANPDLTEVLATRYRRAFESIGVVEALTLPVL